MLGSEPELQHQARDCASLLHAWWISSQRDYHARLGNTSRAGSQEMEDLPDVDMANADGGLLSATDPFIAAKQYSSTHPPRLLRIASSHFAQRLSHTAHMFDDRDFWRAVACRRHCIATRTRPARMLPHQSRGVDGVESRRRPSPIRATSMGRVVAIEQGRPRFPENTTLVI